MSDTIWVAIIGALGLVIAAGVTAYFTHLANTKKLVSGKVSEKQGSISVPSDDDKIIKDERKNKNIIAPTSKKGVFVSNVVIEAETRAVIYLENNSGYDYRDVFVEIIDGDGVLDPRHSQPQLPARVNLYSKDGKMVLENTVWYNRSIMLMTVASYDKTKNNIRFLGQNIIYFLESGSVDLFVKGKTLDGRRDVKEIKVTATIDNSKLKIQVHEP
jgi:hypothetical protein